MNRNRKLTKSIAAAMAGMMLAGQTAAGVYAAESAETETTEKVNITATENAAGTSAEKEETVYVKSSATGAPDEVIVSAWLKNTDAADTLTDVTDLQDIENVKGEETFSQNGSEVVWNADGKDIYYQGTTDRELPVEVQISYYLDGKEISPEELAGKDGHVRIRFTYVNREKSGEVYTPFAMVTGMVLPSEHFSNVTVEHGRLVSDGEKEMVIGMGFPGVADSLNLEGKENLEEIEIPDYFEMEADVTDFELSMTMTAATNLDLAKFGLDDNKNGLLYTSDAADE